ncbi:MAG: GNAT family N-acetyltransferase [Planctomycetota bacterium]
MAEEVCLHVVSKAEFGAGKIRPDWEDPEQMTAASPHVRRMLLDNPLSKSADDPVRIYVTVGSRLAGRLSVVMGEMLVKGEPLSVIWGSNLLVSPDFRGMGLGTKLVNCWSQLHHTVAGCGANPAAMAIYRKLGWIVFSTPSYFLVCHSRKFVAGYLRARAAAAVVSPVVDTLLASRRGLGRLFRGASTRGLGAELAESMPSDFDVLLARQLAPVVTHRSATWINWLLKSGADDEQRDYRLYFVRNARGGTVGYFMLQQRCLPLIGKRFKDVTIGSLKEWGIFDDQQVDASALVLLSIRASLAWGADAVQIQMSGDDVARVMHKVGSKVRDDLMVVLNAVPPSPLANQEYQIQGNWRFTPSEGDGFFV